MSGGWIDLHAHILPGLDHGCPDTETALWQLAQAARAGVGTVAATSHFYPQDQAAARFLALRARAFARLCEGYTGDVTVLPGAEITLCEGLQNMPELPQFCIQGTRTLLIELSSEPLGLRHLDTLEALRSDGYEVLIAHLERYSSREIAQLLDAGFSAQCNAASLCSLRHRAQMLRLIAQGRVTALGSDIHERGTHYRKYARAMKLLGQLGETVQGAMRGRLGRGDSPPER